MKKLLLSSLSLIMASGLHAQALLSDQLRPAGAGPWLGQSLPVQLPQAFAPELLASLSPWVAGTEFSPDGLSLFLHVGTSDYSAAQLYFCEFRDGSWSPLARPSFLEGFSFSMEAVFVEGGQAVMFTGRKTGAANHLWIARREGQGWGKAVALAAPIASEANEFRGSLAADGSLYFGSERDGGMRVYRARDPFGPSPSVELVGPPVSVGSYDGDPCVAPDGRWLLFYSCRAGGFGGADLYVAFADGKGGWQEPVNLGPKYNTKNDEFGAHLSADGKYLSFVRHSFGRRDTLFWVESSAIDRLRP